MSLSIAHTHWAFFPVCGGVESHLATLIDALERRGHTVDLFHGTEDAAWPDGGTKGLSYSPLLDLSAETVTPSDREEIRETLAGYDIIHAHNVHYFSSEKAQQLLQLFGDLSGIPRFHTIHEAWENGIHRNVLEWDGWTNQFVIGSFIERSLQERGTDISPESVTYAVDDMFYNRRQRDDARRALGLPADAHVLVHPARLLPWKGADISLDVVEQLLEDGFEVYLALTDTPDILDWEDELGAYRKRIIDRVRSYESLSDHVLIESFPRTQMPTLYAAADLILYPTTGEEPLGLVPAEAIASHRLPVVSNSGGLTETVTHRHNGIVVPKDDPDTLADEIKAMLKNPDLWERLVANGDGVRAARRGSVMADEHLNQYRKYL